MGKIIRLTERDLTKLVEDVLNQDKEPFTLNREIGMNPKDIEVRRKDEENRFIEKQKMEEIDDRIRVRLRRTSQHDNPEKIINMALILVEKGEQTAEDISKYLIWLFKDIKIKSEHMSKFY